MKDLHLTLSFGMMGGITVLYLYLMVRGLCLAISLSRWGVGIYFVFACLAGLWGVNNIIWATCSLQTNEVISAWFNYRLMYAMGLSWLVGFLLVSRALKRCGT